MTRVCSAWQGLGKAWLLGNGVWRKVCDDWTRKVPKSLAQRATAGPCKLQASAIGTRGT